MTVEDQLVSLGRAFARARAEKRLTQAEVAKRAEVSQALLSLIERGQRDPQIDTLWRLADVLEIKLGALLSSEELAERGAADVMTARDTTHKGKEGRR
jgi:transcriptional regulator with XRE-family HTH domain